jgi:hypothetical protein
MNMKFLSNALSAAEVSFLKWQYGFDEADAPFERALWHAILRAWEADNAPASSTRYLARLGCAGGFADEVALYVSYKSERGNVLWNDLIRRAGLADRRTSEVDPVKDRRRAANGD